jgi:hypothetical protein
MPGVAGFAALVRNFMGQYAYPSPGFVNAFLIMSGRNQSAAAVNNDIGAGLLLMPPSQVNWGSVDLSTANWDITIPVNAPYTNFDVAIWWPETSARHNDVDLTIINPNGANAAWSASASSIFEKVRGAVNGVYGNWKIRIIPWDVSGTQTVYWASAKRP